MFLAWGALACAAESGSRYFPSCACGVKVSRVYLIVFVSSILGVSLPLSVRVRHATGVIQEVRKTQYLVPRAELAFNCDARKVQQSLPLLVFTREDALFRNIAISSRRRDSNPQASVREHTN